MLLTASRSIMDRIEFPAQPTATPVALLAAVNPMYDGLKVYVSREDSPADFLEPSKPRYHVYIGTSILLRPIGVIDSGLASSDGDGDLTIVTTSGSILLPANPIKFAPYYKYTKMYHVLDEHTCVESVGHRVEIRRHA